MVVRLGETIRPPFSARSRRLTLGLSGLNVVKLLKSIVLPTPMAFASTAPPGTDVRLLRFTVPPASATSRVAMKPAGPVSEVTPGRFTLLLMPCAEIVVLMLAAIARDGGRQRKRRAVLSPQAAGCSRRSTWKRRAWRSRRSVRPSTPLPMVVRLGETIRPPFSARSRRLMLGFSGLKVVKLLKSIVLPAPLALLRQLLQRST